MAANTFLWHDYETFGSLFRPWDRPGTVAPKRARPSQFAAIRTDENLKEIGSPIELHCQPSDVEPPSIDACLTTGITPQQTLDSGLSESEFFERVREQFTPGTCGVGWNSFGYDDEITRFGFWRNLLLPVYDREWKDGRSRWDLLPVFRLAYATRPEQLTWPQREDGTVSLKLEDLAPANGVTEHDAHDAVGDVRATIELARVFRKNLPKLWAHARSMTNQTKVTELFSPGPEPLLLSDWWIGPERCYGTLVSTVMSRRKQRVVIDLDSDPEALLDLSASEIHRRMFDRREGEERLPVQAIKINQSPMVAPAAVLGTSESWERLGLDQEVVAQRAQQVFKHRSELAGRVGEVLAEPPDRTDRDVEERLYGGSFPEDWEVKEISRARRGGATALRNAIGSVNDERLAELLFRYMAIEHPSELDDAESARWQQHLRERIIGPGLGGDSRIQESLDLIDARRQEGAETSVLDQVEEWTRHLAMQAGVELASR